MRRRRSTCSIHSDSSEIDIDHIAEQELHKLLRQFHVLEGSRQTYCVTSQDVIRRQQHEIQGLQKERDDILLSLKASSSCFHRHTDSNIAGNMSGILFYGDAIDEQLESELQKLTLLKAEILNWEKKLAGRRTGGATSCLGQRSELNQTERTTRILENKLEKGLGRFHKILTKNRMYREELRILHVERKHFRQIYFRLEKELQEIRKAVKDMMFQTTAAFDARVEAQSKRALLKEKTTKELVQYQVERNEQERTISHDQNLKAFLSIKNNERSSNGGGQDNGQDSNRRQMEDRQHGRLDSKDWGMDVLEEAFQHIQAVTGENDLDKLVTAFIETEEQNLALLKFVNEQHNEAQTIQDHIKQLSSEMESYLAEERKLQLDQLAVQKTIGGQQQVAEEELGAYLQHISSVNKILDQLKTGINTLFYNIKCERSVIDDKLGSSIGIRDSNIMVYLGLVERRTNELLSLLSFLSSKDLDSDYSPRVVARHLLGQSQQVETPCFTVEPPLLREDIDPEESVALVWTKPLSKDDFLRLAKKRLKKKTRQTCPESNRHRATHHDS